MLPLFPHVPAAMLLPFPHVPAAVMASASAPADAVVAICGWASSHGPLGLCTFVAAHAAAVVVCFPATILFELAAGFAFGIYQGAALAWTAKVTAAAITFFISSGIARTALSNAGVEAAAARAFAAQPSLTRLGQNVEQDGARYTLLARLSPIPSWLNNYGLAFAGVRFVDYAPATALVTLPAVLTHAYAGSVLSSLLALANGDGFAPPSSLASSALSGLSAVGSGLLLRQLTGALATSEEDFREAEAEEVQVEAEADDVESVDSPRRRRSGDPQASLLHMRSTLLPRSSAPLPPP